MPSEDHKLKTIKPDKVLQDGDRITVTPKNISGEAWTPKLRDFHRFLKSIGFAFERHGKGDHEIWKAPDGRSFPINAAKGDRKQTDIACIRTLARILQEDFGRLLDQIRAFVVG
jgi:predicted RNA binding protein YcfA (HicA-like mRNA interferase family)